MRRTVAWPGLGWAAAWLSSEPASHLVKSLICSLGGRGMPARRHLAQAQAAQDFFPGRVVGLQIVGVQRHHAHARGLQLVVVTGGAILHQHVLVVGRRATQAAIGRRSAGAFAATLTATVSAAALPSKTGNSGQGHDADGKTAAPDKRRHVPHLPGSRRFRHAPASPPGSLISDPVSKVNQSPAAGTLLQLRTCASQQSLYAAQNNGLAWRARSTEVMNMDRRKLLAGLGAVAAAAPARAQDRRPTGARR